MSSRFIHEDGKAATRVYIVGGEGISGGGGESMRFLHGTTDPTIEVGKPNDVYLNTASGDLFINNNGNWSLLMNIKGEDGRDGNDGRDGQDGVDGFPTEEQWNALVSRVDELESKVEQLEQPNE